MNIQQAPAHDIDAAIAAVLQAGAEIMPIYAREFSVEEKEDRSPLTEADTRAHTEIAAVLAVRTPSIPILSEEGATIPAAERQGWQRYWLVDPLDGTKEFIKKNDEFTVNIALMETRSDGMGASGTATPTGGVVYVPATRILYVGVVGNGAWSIKVEPEGTARAGAGTPAPPTLAHIAKHGTPLPSVLEYADRNFTVVASRSHLSAATEAYIETLRADHPYLELLSAGSSIKICRVAEGSADEYPRFAPTMEWDTAAGDAVARAAGCEVLAWDAEGGAMAGPTEAGAGAPAGPLTYNKEDLHNPWFLVRRR
ncbi:MAG TPA: 3'(2'),5'-bisphosphate nucleotidase CysQ [Alkalispirochaeta sp.]|nr:3'(2'),5'-bisphosphate nucleotidase CysQ [Alkalispirochaeta sp.]